MAATVFHSAKVYSSSIEWLRGARSTQPATRDFDGLEVGMLTPLHPQGLFLPIFSLSTGHPLHEGDMLIEQNVVIPLRDRIKLYSDIYRPPKSDKVPIILVWSPYGKHRDNNTLLGNIPERFSLPKSAHSRYEGFEGPGPGFWVTRGYAVVNVDIRGSWNSEVFMNLQDQRDGYDAIDA
ncbi:Alpha/Beta hydrolase protein [Aspergillus carlsbadensis]|nr:Alpha/Beta hydrolase protein [Aspergillus carlsbadensis]